MRADVCVEAAGPKGENAGGRRASLHRKKKNEGRAPLSLIGGIIFPFPLPNNPNRQEPTAKNAETQRGKNYHDISVVEMAVKSGKWPAKQPNSG